MRYLPAGAVLALALLLNGCGDSSPKLDARWHFVGADGVRAQREAPALHKFFSHSNSPAIGARLLTNSVLAATTWISGGKPAADAAQLAQPLVEDLLGHESVGEVWRFGDGTVEVAMAVRVTAERAAIWADNFPKWVKPMGGGVSGSWINADKGWLIAVSRNDSPRASAFRKAVSSLPPNPNRLLEIEAAPGAWPGIKAVAVASNGAVRWSGTFKQPGMAALSLAEWHYPTNAIRDPLIAFTAVRGISPGVMKAFGIENYLSGQEIGQIYHWAQNDSPFQTFAAVHLSDPGKVVSKVHGEIAPLYSTNGAPGTRSGLIMYDDDKKVLALVSAPGAMPMLISGSTNGPGFLGVSLFPKKRSASPLPKELLNEFEKPDVVLYDWEMTSENAIHWAANLQVKDLAQGLRPPSGDGVSQTWLNGTISSVENTVTEVRQTGAGEFAFTRKAPGGFSAMEWVLLTRWIEPPTTRPARSVEKGVSPPFNPQGQPKKQ